MTKKNIAAMNDMEKISGGILWTPGMPMLPDRPIPGGLWMAKADGFNTSNNEVTAIPLADNPPVNNNKDIPYPHCGNL